VTPTNRAPAARHRRRTPDGIIGRVAEHIIEIGTDNHPHDGGGHGRDPHANAIIMPPATTTRPLSVLKLTVMHRRADQR
jgi:hypothetical protein